MWIVTKAWYFDRSGSIQPATQEVFDSKEEAEEKRSYLERVFDTSGRIFEVRKVEDVKRKPNG